MMTLVCIRQFGNYVVGDEVADIPDDALFDTYHFAAKQSHTRPKGAKKEDDN